MAGCRGSLLHRNWSLKLYRTTSVFRAFLPRKFCTAEIRGTPRAPGSQVNYEPAARSSLAAVHLAHLVTAFAQFNHDVQDPRSRRALRVVRMSSQPQPTALRMRSHSGGKAPVCTSVCVPYACLCVMTRARLRSHGLSFAATQPNRGVRRPGLGGRDAHRRALC